MLRIFGFKVSSESSSDPGHFSFFDIVWTDGEIEDATSVTVVGLKIIELKKCVGVISTRKIFFNFEPCLSRYPGLQLQVPVASSQTCVFKSQLHSGMTVDSQAPVSALSSKPSLQLQSNPPSLLVHDEFS